ncbi:MAG: DUF5723 family protein [Bacteroidales bacterium]|nr:DUF5723 family protein [Bacteroidales bacterium]
MKKIFVIAIMFQLIFVLNSQNDLIIHGLNIIPQSTYLNPSFVPQCKVHVGLPFLSSFYLDLGHNGFNAQDVLSISQQDSVIINMNSLLDKLKKNNLVFTNLNFEFFSMGFKLKQKHYFNFYLAEKFGVRMYYPRDLIEFIYKGNGALLDEKMHIGRLSLNFMHYREYALGYAYLWKNNLYLGGRIKFLFGKSNFHTRKLDASLTTTSPFFDITAQADIDLRSSGLFGYDSTNEFDGREYLMNTKNFGLGIDAGATYKYNDKFTFAASIVDFGYIRWKTNTTNFVNHNPNATFTFSGIDISDFVGDRDSTDTINMEDKLNAIKDSIFDIFKIDTNYNAYTTMLNTKIHLSGFYQLTKNDKISAILRIWFYDKGLHPALSVSYLRRLGNVFNISASYSITNSNYTNLGLGFSLKPGFFQIYLLTDNILSPFIWNKYVWDGGNSSISLPRNWKYMNVHFGINLVFGCKPPKDYIPIF